MANTPLKLVTPATKKRAVTPRRRPNSEFRSREHLTESEVEGLIEAAKDNRYGHRDATMILVVYRHGLRASEVCDLRWEQIVSTPEQKCIGSPERKYINDACKKAPELGAFLSGIRLGLDYPPAYPGWHGVIGACFD